MLKKILMFLMLTALMVVLPQRLVHAKTLTIAVIDSGVDSSLPHLCKFGHKSFAKDLPNPLQDVNGHGTHIAGLISSTAGDGDYCLVSISYYDGRLPGNKNLANLVNALQYAVNIKVDFINLSGGGAIPDKKEFKAIENALKRHTKVVVAAGNEKSDLDKKCDYFPACYDSRLVVVGNLQDVNSNISRSPSSNYGNVVTRWEIGTNVLSTLPGGRSGRMSGTSQACAIASGKLIRERLQK